MFNKIILTDVIRDIKKSKNRFLSIFVIIALGSGLFVGIKSFYPNMLLTIDKYYNDYALMDLQVKSTYGFDVDDINTIKDFSVVKNIVPQYINDYFINNKENEIIRIYSFNKDNYQLINKPILKKGRFPLNSGEIVLEDIDHRFEIGDSIELNLSDDSLHLNTFTIVGFIDSPLNITYNKMPTKIGSGEVSMFSMINEIDFNYDVYTDLFLTFNNTDKYDLNSKEYAQQVKKNKNGIKILLTNTLDKRFLKIKEDAYKELNDNIIKYNNEKKDAEQKLEKALIDLNDAKKKIQNGYIEIDNGFNTLTIETNNAKATLDNEYNKLVISQKGLNEQYNLLSSLENLVNSNLDYQYIVSNPEYMKLIESSSVFDEKLPYLIHFYLLTKDQTTYNTLISTFQQIRSTLDTYNQQINEGFNQINKGRQQLDQEYEKNYNYLVNEKEKLKQSENDLEEGYQEYYKNKDDVSIKFKEAWDKIEEAKNKIETMEKPITYTFTRSNNDGYDSFIEDGKKVDAMSIIFPVFFVLVVALVCITTMTRMVEEQRIEIGTLKALGYSNLTIISKFLIYAFVATVLGALIGLILGFQILPNIIYSAYQTNYRTPNLLTPYRNDYAFYTTIFALLCTIPATIYSAYFELISKPATLMRPKAPKEGKRNMLEYIPFIWNRLSFLQKVSARNIFRYKKRVLMTTIGISGCTALMLTGFGLKDAITTIVNKQFDEIVVADGTIILDDNYDHDSITKTLKEQNNITDYEYIRQDKISATNGSKDYEVYLNIPKNANNFNNYIKFRTRMLQTPVLLQNEGVVINEKLSILLKIKLGDQIDIKINDKDYKVKVTGIIENYALNYVFMTKDFYEKITDSNLVYNGIYFNLNNSDHDSRRILSENLLENKDIAYISYNDEIATKFRNMISSLNKIVYVLIIAAGALAFVVLYNLSNINVNERLRELATIKVLGFYDKEVSSYIDRENSITTLFGVLLGLALGIILHQYVIITAETDIVMFGRSIHISSYIYSILITYFFTLIVNIILYFKLKHIDMVESLKAIE